MRESFVYSYRLTYFGGTAPCYDDNQLTLAICKRDMRRVIGRDFSNNPNADYWIVGIIGAKLSKYKEIPEFKGMQNQVLYVAKVQDVIEFQDYFVPTNHRIDNIYIQTTEQSDFQAGGKFYDHKLDVDVHKEIELQERDWDIAHNDSKKYVLDAKKQYRFIDGEESSEIIKRVGDRPWATGVGHKWFKDEDGQFSDYLEQLVAKGSHIEALPLKLQNSKTCKGCGNRRGNVV